jgi:hypothetical protein
LGHVWYSFPGDKTDNRKGVHRSGVFALKALIEQVEVPGVELYAQCNCSTSRRCPRVRAIAPDAMPDEDSEHWPRSDLSPFPDAQMADRHMHLLRCTAQIISRFITDLEILHFTVIPTQPAPSATLVDGHFSIWCLRSVHLARVTIRVRIRF